jgi:signal transduction histidine kinase
VNVFITARTAEGGAVAQIDVVDAGPGISDDMLPRVFERFATGRQRHGGMGIGLYLAKRIANAHGGDVTAERDPGGGARFVIRLPLPAASGMRAAAE